MTFVTNSTGPELVDINKPMTGVIDISDGVLVLLNDLWYYTSEIGFSYNAVTTT